MAKMSGSSALPKVNSTTKTSTAKNKPAKGMPVAPGALRSASSLMPNTNVVTEIKLPPPRTPKAHPTSAGKAFTTVPPKTKIQ